MMGGALAVPALFPLNISAEVIVIDPIFEYPVAPEEIKTLQEKADWVMQHFWDKMDFKNKEALNQAAVNDAMRTYVLPMQWAAKEEVDKSVEKLLKQLSKNPTLLLQFTKAAEQELYGQRASIWIDEIYCRFLETFNKNKKVPAIRKKRYERQLTQIKNSLVKETPASFTYTTPGGNPGKFEPIGVFTIIEFGDPDCDDCRMAKLKMETNIRFSELVDKGLVNVMFIVPDPTDGWQDKLKGMPQHWIAGGSDTVSDILDIRSTPSFFVVGKDGKLIAKNIGYETAMSLAFKEFENKSTDGDATNNGANQ